MKNLIDLKTAYATQTTHEGNASEWIIYNTEKEIIYRLPKHYTEKQVSIALKLGRHFEHIAFNAGIRFQKDLVPNEMKTLQGMVLRLTEEKKLIIERNLLLAAELDKLSLLNT